MNKQREVIYTQRRDILGGVSLKEEILEVAERIIDDILSEYAADNVDTQESEIISLVNTIRLKFGLENIIKPEVFSKGKIKEELLRNVISLYEEKEKSIGQDLMRHLERMVFLQIIDGKWKDHLYAMDSLREGIGLRAYGQRDPLIEYKREAFNMFNQMMSSIEEEAVEMIFKLQPARPERFKGVFTSISQEYLHPEGSGFKKPEEEPLVMRDPRLGPSLTVTPPVSKPHPKVGRNDPCPCGSGKKYKKCCGK